MVGILILGNPREGKTLLATVLVYLFQKHTFSNYAITFNNFKIEEINLSKLFEEEYSNCVFVLDEAYAYLEARIAKSNLNRYLSYFLFQSGKRDIHVILTAQLMSTIDLRFRELMDYVILSQKIVDKEGNVDRFRYVIYSVRKQKTKTISISNQYLQFFYNNYNTKQIILPEAEKYMKKLLPESQKVEESEKIAETIRNELKDEQEITKNMVKVFFIKNKISDVFFEYTYPQVIRRKEGKKK